MKEDCSKHVEQTHNGTKTETALRMRWGRPAVVLEQHGFEGEAVGFAGESVVVSVCRRLVSEKIALWFASTYVKISP